MRERQVFSLIVRTVGLGVALYYLSSLFQIVVMWLYNPFRGVPMQPLADMLYSLILTGIPVLFGGLLMWYGQHIADLVYRSVHSPGRCAHCGYNLRATPDRCPECGTVPETAEKS